jgi:carboxymethylenebutenolidase
MCDQFTDRDNDEYLKKHPAFTRRDFSKLTAGAALAVLFPRVANAAEITRADVLIETPEGEADCYFVHPATGKYPGVVIWPDIRGLRTAFKVMGDRLAQSGYSVLVVNPFYRGARAPILPEGASHRTPESRAIIGPLRETITAEGNVTDARAFVGWLDRQPSVDTGRRIGTTGYCMGGPIVMRTAAAVPDRVGAAATFHGGGLVTDQEDSPHLLIPKMRAHFLIAVAENDDERDPEAKVVLKEEFAKAGLPAEIEVYAGAMHGWCPPDSPVYHEEQAEKAWNRLLELFSTALA